MYQLSVILFIAGFIAAVYAVYLDWQSSKNFIYYAQTEGNRKTTDKYGYFDVKKNLIISGAMLGVVAVAGIIGMSLNKSEGKVVLLFGAIFCLIPIYLRGSAAITNKRSAKINRERQTNFLRKIKAIAVLNGGAEEIAVEFNNYLITTRGGRTYYNLFGWVYSEQSDLNMALPEIQKRIVDIALQDESRWFPA